MDLKRVVFVNRFAPPDVSATAQLLGDLGASLSGEFEVTIVAGDQDYLPTAYGKQTPPRNRSEHFDVVRLRASRFGRARIAGRALDYLTFHCSALWWLMRNLRSGDVVVALTDPPLISLTAAFATKLRSARLVNWVQDLFPEVAIQLGQPKGLRFVAWMLRACRDWSLHNAAMNVAIGDRMAQFLPQLGVAESRVCVIPNWAHAEAGQGTARATNALRARLALGDSFVVMYAGNLGRAHDAAIILDAAEQLRSRAGLVFLILGDGHGHGWLGEKVRALNLQNIRFEPYQPLAALGDTLGAGDLHLVTLRPELEGLIVPSKFYGIAAAARPMAFVGDPQGELAQIITRGDCGVVIEPGNSRQLATAIVRMQEQPENAARMGRNALELLEREFSRSEILSRWSRLLTSIHSQGRGPATTHLQGSKDKP